jgi:hypothetical protein
MPIDIRIKSQNGDSTVTIWNDAQEQTFTIYYSAKPSAILLDPDEWILKDSFSSIELSPLEYHLEQNYPNPFNSGTVIEYSLPRREHVNLKIYDILGQEIAVIVDAKQSPGFYKYQWAPRNITSGIYFYRLITESIQMQKKMIFLK